MLGKILECLGALRLRKSAASLCRVLRVMENGIDDYSVAEVLAKNGIRETSDQTSPKILVNRGMNFWVASYRLDAGIDTPQKLLTQPGVTLIVPVISIAEVLLDFGSKHQLSDHGGHESCFGSLPTRGQSLDYLRGSAFFGPVLPFANRGSAPPQDLRRYRPTDLRQAGASLKGSN